MPGAKESAAVPRRPAAGHGRFESISGRENQWLKKFRGALRDGEMTRDGWIAVEGPHLVEEAVRSGLPVQAMLTAASGEGKLSALLDHLPAMEGEVRLLVTPDKMFAAVSGTVTPQGMAALIRPRAWTPDDVLRSTGSLLLVLVGVQDPGNVGTILRSAEAFGAGGALICAGTANPWSQKVLRASAGSALRLPIAPAAAPSVLLAQLKIHGLRSVAASMRAEISAENFDFSQPTALFIGSEAAGLPPDIERSADARVRIPLAEGLDSLNAAVAASVLLYEAARQRGRIQARENQFR